MSEANLLNARLKIMPTLLLLTIVAGCGGDTPVRFDLKLDTSIPSDQQSVDLPIFNPLPSPAKLVGFQTSCACGTPDFEVVEMPSRTLVSIPTKLDTQRIQRSTPIGRELILEPLFQSKDGVVPGVPIVLQVSQDCPLWAEPSTIALSDSSSVTIKISSTDKVDSIRVAEVPEGIVVEKIQLDDSGKSSAWSLILACQAIRAISDAQQVVKVQGIDKNERVLAETAIPVSTVVTQSHYLSSDTLVFSGSRGHFEATLNQIVPHSQVSLDEKMPDGFAVEGFSYSEDTGRIQFDLAILGNKSQQARLIVRVGSSGDSLPIYVYRLGVAE